MNNKEYFLSLIKGDTFYLRANVSQEELQIISTISFIVSDLNLNLQMTEDNYPNDDGSINYGYSLEISNVATANFKAMRTTYAIVVTYQDGVETVLRNGLLIIYERE